MVQANARSHADKILKKLTTCFPETNFKLEFDYTDDGAKVAFRYKLLCDPITYFAKRFDIWACAGFLHVNDMVSKMEEFIEKFEAYEMCRFSINVLKF